MLLPSLWFSAWRCRCSLREKDLVQPAQLQMNFFFVAVVDDVDEEPELDASDGARWICVAIISSSCAREEGKWWVRMMARV